VRNTPTVELAEGLCVAELPTDTLPPGSRLLFTWRETEQDLWHGTDHHIEVCP
jgi:hypothetical protein